jgi:hypothetical protein
MAKKNSQNKAEKVQNKDEKQSKEEKPKQQNPPQSPQKKAEEYSEIPKMQPQVIPNDDNVDYKEKLRKVVTDKKPSSVIKKQRAQDPNIMGNIPMGQNVINHQMNVNYGISQMNKGQYSTLPNMAHHVPQEFQSNMYPGVEHNLAQSAMQPIMQSINPQILQSMNQMSPNMMTEMTHHNFYHPQLGMQQDFQHHAQLSPPIQTAHLKPFLSPDGGEPKHQNHDKISGKKNEQQGIPNPKTITFSIDLTSPEKVQEFIAERKFQVVKRLKPALHEKYQKEDLERSISEIKTEYEQKIKELEMQQQQK